jgi:hypothetical protein
MTALLVPITLDVLAVRDAGQPEDWAFTAFDVPDKPYKGPAKKHKLLPDPFQPLAQARPVGAYLHWALPDALTRGGGDSEGNMKFPPLPDRWLIMRLSGAPGAGKRTVDAWLIPDAGAQTPSCVPVAPGMSSTPAATQGLSMISFGDMSWAGYYDNVVNRFGMFDPLTGITGPVAYAVCGWYGDAAKDPVANTSESDFHDKMAALGWAPNQLASGMACPSRSVYHGMAVSIGWPDAAWTKDAHGILGVEGDLRPASAAGVEVGVGETLAEAIAAVVLPGDSSPDLGSMVEGVLKGALPNPSDPDGPAMLDTALHVSRFGSKPSGQLLFSIPATCRDDLNKGSLPAAARTAFTAHDILLPTDETLIEVIKETADLRWWLNVLDASLAIVDSYTLTKGTSSIGVYTSARSEHIWQPPPYSPTPVDAMGSLTPVHRTLPRVWHALDPSIVIHGGGKSARHGGDGRYSQSGDLACRTTGDTLTAFGVAGGNPGKGSDVLPAAPLAALPAAWGAPSETADLLVELACIDPGSSPDLAASANAPSAVAAARAAWWITFDPAHAGDTFAAAYTGTLPSPVGVTIPGLPWTPVHLEWSATYLPSPRGAHDWRLGTVDFDIPEVTALPAPDPTHPLSGRVVLNGTPTELINAVTSADDGIDTHADADLLAGGLGGIAEQLRGDWLGAVLTKIGGNTTLKQDLRPDGFTALRAGFLHIDRIRLVDTFGRHLDILGGAVAGGQLVVGSSLAVAGQPDIAALRPRFTAPARAMFRFVDPSGGQVEAGPGLSPVCGYVLPSLLDGTLEFFDAEGNGLGQLHADPVTGTAWELDPGQPAALGARPSAAIKTNPFLGQLADGLIAADTALSTAQKKGTATDVQTSLVSLLAALDITRWTVDLSGQAGNEHLSLLLGHPVAVVRALLKIDVQDPREPPENAATAVPVKLGTLAHSQDGLLAYYVADDFSRAYIVDPALLNLVDAVGLASLDSPYIDQSGFFYATPGTTVALTLLMMPGSDVHVTTGLLPQKKVSLMRDWTASGLSCISPSLRRGPILRDESATRLPLPADIRADWFWHHRGDPSQWVAEKVVAATGEAILPDGTVQASSGWLQAQMIPDAAYATTPVQMQVSFIKSRKVKGGKQLLGIGGKNPDQSLYLLPIAQAVQMQESGRFIFFIDLPATLEAEDVNKNLPALAHKLKGNGDDVSEFLLSKLSATTVQALSAYHGGKTNPGNLPQLLAQDLTAVVQGPSIWDPDRFSAVNLRPETRAFLADAKGTGTDLPRLNRFLLEDAYPKELRKMRVYTHVIRNLDGTKYLRTTADKKDRNNLITLPEYGS